MKFISDHFYREEDPKNHYATFEQRYEKFKKEERIGLEQNYGFKDPEFLLGVINEIIEISERRCADFEEEKMNYVQHAEIVDEYVLNRMKGESYGAHAMLHTLHSVIYDALEQITKEGGEEK